MTMDIQNSYQNYKESSPDNRETGLDIESARTSQITNLNMQSTIINQTKASKRSFDVAFLMMPDEKLHQKQSDRQLRVSKQLFNDEEWDHQAKKVPELLKTNDFNGNDSKEEDDRLRSNNNISPSFSADINIDVGVDEFPSRAVYCSDSENSERSRSRPNSNESAVRQPKFLPEYKNKIFDDPTLISMQSRARYDNRYLERITDNSPRSAFTKVTNFSMRSPNPSLSPDNLLYQNSISPPMSATTPPVSTFSKTPGFNNLLTPAHLLNGNTFLKAQSMPSPNYHENSTTPQMHSRSNGPYNKAVDFSEKPNDLKTPSHNKMNFLPFRPDMPYLQAGSSYPFSVQSFQAPNPDFMKFPAPAREPINPLIANPAAAILSTLLPPTLAAFSLPAQNVCAKCNISFRMTSDLVYHMRTHHRSESFNDPHRRKREDKLKCPVCNESFRERHHLTRHMTAHQDKEGDMDDVTPSQSYNKKSKQFYPHSGGPLVHK